MYFHSLITKIIFAKKQIIIFVVMLISIFVMMFFFLFFKTFTKYYIDELKLIYPSVYLIKEQPIQNYYLKNIEAYAEIFELNIDNFNISFDKNNTFTVGSLGIRSFNKKHIPKVLSKIYSDGDFIYFSQKIYKQLCTNKNFKGYIYIKSDVNSKFYKFKVKEFELHDNSKWVLMDNVRASKIYRKNFFNNVSFYSNLDEKIVKKNLKQKFKTPIYTWDDNIPLVSRALKENMLLIFFWIAIAVAVLSISSIVFFARELTDDLTNITNYAFFYGLSLKFVFLYYLIIANTIFLFITTMGYVFAYLLNNILTLSLWDVHSYSDLYFLFYILSAIFILTTISIYFGLLKLYYSKKYGLHYA